MVEHQFPRTLLFCCHLHHKLDDQTAQLVEEADAVHCQSSGFFPVLAHALRNQYRSYVIVIVIAMLPVSLS